MLIWHILNSGHWTTAWIRMKIMQLSGLLNWLNINCQESHDIWYHLQNVTFGMSRREHNPTAAAIFLKTERQPQGFMQNYLNYPCWERWFKCFFFKDDAPNTLYISFGNLKILEQRLPCGTHQEREHFGFSELHASPC